MTPAAINIELPRWDQSTYEGRARHFLSITNPLNVLVSSKELDRSKEIITKYRAGSSLESLNITEEELWKAKVLYDSAFHPDTGEKMPLIGRMSAQVPMNMTITGCMMSFYKSTPQVVFWQWFNQSFNALVNYTNRSGSNPVPLSTLGISYLSATTGAVATALTLNKFAQNAPPVIGRFVPFAAVAAANCINIPLMRLTEVKDGIELQNEKGEKVGNSRRAASDAIASVTISRIGMAAPGMILGPLAMNFMESRRILYKHLWARNLIQIGLTGLCLSFATPLCCAIFSQRVRVPVDYLEPSVQKEIHAKDPDTKFVYYNKGL